MGKLLSDGEQTLASTVPSFLLREQKNEEKIESYLPYRYRIFNGGQISM